MSTSVPRHSRLGLDPRFLTAAKGVRSDKGFKEINLMRVTRSLSDFLGYDVTSIQVHNHLRKWRSRWQRITQLRGLSGALWNDEKKMIVLEK